MGGALRGKRVLVTGAARGLGASAAAALAAEGAECLQLDRLEMDPGLGRARRCDLGDRKSTLAAAAFAKQAVAGDLAALVHCAGVLHRAPLGATGDPEWDETLAVNLTSAFLLARALLPELAAGGGGSVVLTSSRAGISGFPGEAAYCASKFGVEGLARALAGEVRSAGISVNTITPGSIRIKPTGLSDEEAAALPAGERGWQSPERLGPAFAALALLRGEPSGRRFEADRLAAVVAVRGLPLPPDAWEER